MALPHDYYSLRECHLHHTFLCLEAVPMCTLLFTCFILCKTNPHFPCSRYGSLRATRWLFACLALPTFCEEDLSSLCPWDGPNILMFREASLYLLYSTRWTIFSYALRGKYLSCFTRRVSMRPLSLVISFFALEMLSSKRSLPDSLLSSDLTSLRS